MVFQHLFSKRMNRVAAAVQPWRTVQERRNAMSLHLILISALLGTLGASVPALGADYPTKTVRIVVPFPAGGVPDILARILAQGLSEKWQQPVVIENRSGANTTIGASFVARSSPDGYTLLFTTDGTFILNPLLYSKLPYSMEELTPVSLVATSVHALAINSSVPARSVKEFVSLAKAKPSQLSYGTSGPASIQRIAMELLCRTEGITLLHVPYKGSTETMTALLAGDISATINGGLNIFPLLENTSIRALAVTSPTRSKFAPNLPTMQEAGVPGFVSQGISGVFVPTGTPAEARNKIHQSIAELLQRTDIKDALNKSFFEPQGKDGDEFRHVIREATERWRRVITEAKIAIE
jgi:tripartite-type tricarboxylate transporter receptor subunit TctC